MENEYVTKATVDESLMRVEEDSACACVMCELNWQQSRRARAELQDEKVHGALVKALARDKDRERRRTISTLYMALGFLAGFVAYLVVRG